MYAQAAHTTDTEEFDCLAFTARILVTLLTQAGPAMLPGIRARRSRAQALLAGVIAGTRVMLQLKNAAGLHGSTCSQGATGKRDTNTDDFSSIDTRRKKA